MAGRLSGKTCFVTGAAQGIGKAVSDAFLRKGAQILVRDLQLERLSTEFAHTAAHIVRVDATDAVEVAAVAAAHPQVGVLVNCAGVVANGPVLDCLPEDLERSFRINVSFP
jgi:2-keto-3-deoxy-L-fuconate dehydrogenase